MAETRKNTEELMPVEHWYNTLGTRLTVFTGTMCMMGWKKGKAVTRSEYEAAVKKFGETSMAGEKKESKQG